MNVTCVVKRAPSGAVSVASNSCDWSPITVEEPSLASTM
jgi:hypothetical protein